MVAWNKTILIFIVIGFCGNCFAEEHISADSEKVSKTIRAQIREFIQAGLLPNPKAGEAEDFTEQVCNYLQQKYLTVGDFSEKVHGTNRLSGGAKSHVFRMVRALVQGSLARKKDERLLQQLLHKLEKGRGGERHGLLLEHYDDKQVVGKLVNLFRETKNPNVKIGILKTIRGYKKPKPAFTELVLEALDSTNRGVRDRALVTCQKIHNDNIRKKVRQMLLVQGRRDYPYGLVAMTLAAMKDLESVPQMRKMLASYDMQDEVNYTWLMTALLECGYILSQQELLRVLKSEGATIHLKKWVVEMLTRGKTKETVELLLETAGKNPEVDKEILTALKKITEVKKSLPEWKEWVKWRNSFFR